MLQESHQFLLLGNMFLLLGVRCHRKSKGKKTVIVSDYAKNEP